MPRYWVLGREMPRRLCLRHPDELSLLPPPWLGLLLACITSLVLIRLEVAEAAVVVAVPPEYEANFAARQTQACVR